MPTANEEFRDSLIRHQIHLMRLVGMMRNRVFEILDATEPEMRQLIESRLATLWDAAGVDITQPGAKSRVLALERAIADLRGKAFTNVLTLWDADLRDMIVNEAEFVSMALKTTMPVVLDPTDPGAARLRSIIRTDPFRGKTLSAWASNIKRADINKIRDEIRIGLIDGDTNREIARRVVGTARLRGSDGITEITRRQAAGITRTAVTAYSNAGKREYFAANKDIITTEVYTATLDARTTAICRALDGQRFPVAEGPYPPQHFSCRSVRIAVVGEDLIGDRPMKASTERMLVREFTGGRIQRRDLLPRGQKGKFDQFSRRRVRQLTGTVPATVNYEQWLRTQSVEFQNDVLGTTKARLFREGKLPLSRYVSRRGDELTLAEMARRDAQAFVSAGLDPNDFLQAA